MNIRKHIPNTITCLSLLSGCVAIVFALQGNLLVALICIIIASCLDFLDGLAARLLKAYSNIGKELDSLSDLVSFGVAPGMMVYALLCKNYLYSQYGGIKEYICFLAFSIPVLSALRLAKFNVDDRQRESFIGLPVPAHALFWASISYSILPLLNTYGGLALALVIGLLACLTSLLLVSEIPMFSLKVKSLAWKGNELRYILVGGGVLCIALAGVLGIAGIIFLYVIMSIFNRKR